jgi:hemolysin activation/secretion protein
LIVAMTFTICAFGQSAPMPVVRTPPAVPQSSELAPRPIAPATDASALPPRAEAAAVAREIGKPQDEFTLDVKGYAVADDAPAVLRAALPRLTAAYVGPGRSYEDLVDAATEVTRFLQRDLGFYLGYAYIPEQVPKDGIVRIGVLEGRLDRVVLKWSDDLPVRREVIEAHLKRLVPGSILRVRDVERVVFLINDLRGITARFDVTAGSVPGTATLVVTPKAEARYSGKVDADLNGSRFLGIERAGVLVSMNSPLGRGDALTATALGSLNGGIAFGLLGYTLPVGSDGLKLGASASVVRYKLDTDEFPLGLNGDAVSSSAYALYPWVRSRNLNLFLIGSLEHKQYTDRQDVSASRTRKNVDSLSLSAAGDFRDSVLTGAVNTYELSLAAGRVNYREGLQPAEDDTGYTKVSGGITRLQNIVSGRLLLYASLRGQWALDNLDTTEQFRLGGPDGVRAYSPGEGTGDSGALMTLELRVLPPPAVFGRLSREMVFGVFYDVGRVRLRNDPTRTVQADGNMASFSGVGLALSWVKPKAFALRASLARPLVGTPRSDPRVRDPRLYLQVSRAF